MADSTWTYRYTVGTALGVDTVAMIIEPHPNVVGDTSVIGLVLVSDGSNAVREVFQFIKGQPFKKWRVPEDVYWMFHDVVPSPDGRFLAYVAQDSTHGSFAMVREIFSGRIIVQGAGRGGCDCDIDRNHARWIAQDSFEIAVDLSGTSGGWEIVSGHAAQRRVHTDTVGARPTWH